MFSVKNFIIRNKYILGIGAFYFVFRLINLTKLPIFNDEAIYLDWGWRETHAPGYLFYSLYDAKQPLLMWIFGISQSILNDPLFAGRIVAVFTGFLTLLGIYFLGNKFFNQKVALLGSIIYIVIPMFSFYDRQALMESVVAAVGVWSVYFIIKMVEDSAKRNAVVLGIILGIGFFIKTSSLIFFLTPIFLILFFVLNKNINKEILYRLFLAVMVFIFVDFFLLINSSFWNSLSSNNRYALTITELIRFPLNNWFTNFFSSMEIMFFFLTPFISLFSILGLIRNFRNKKTKIISLLFLMSLLIVILISRNISQRYLVSFFPLIVVFAADFLVFLYAKKKIIGFVFIFLSIFISITITGYQIIYPLSYIYNLSKFTRFSEAAYISGFTSGVGVNEAVSYINKESIGRNIVVGVALNTGNPESAIIDFFQKSKNIQVIYLDGRYLKNQLDKVNCISSNQPLYFVSRDDQLWGLERYFEKKKFIKKLIGNDGIGIYKYKENCIGKTLNLDF